MLDSTGSQQPKLLDEVRNALRLHHYPIHTERSSVEWIVRFVRFHDLQSREDFFPPGKDRPCGCISCYQPAV